MNDCMTKKHRRRADKGDDSAERKATLRTPGKVWDMKCKALKGADPHCIDAHSNSPTVMVRFKVKHTFRVINR